MNPIVAIGNPGRCVATQQSILSAENTPPAQALRAEGAQNSSQKELRKIFEAFLGEVYFGQMLKAMRRTVDKPAYVYGGMAEDIFTQQLDQVLAESLAKTVAPEWTGPMFKLFTLSRR